MASTAPALVLGYAALAEPAITSGIGLLAAAVADATDALPLRPLVRSR